jgi:hypothetical protein
MGRPHNNDVDRMSVKLAMLLQRSPPLEPRGSSSTDEPWAREDQATIAGALGAVTAGKPQRRYPMLVLSLRLLPDWPHPEKDRRLVERTTTGLLWRAFRPRWAAMDPREAPSIEDRLSSGLITELLHSELRAPAACNRCRGRGLIARTRDEHGQLHAPKVFDCPDCRGAAVADRGYKKRAHALGLRSWAWGKFGNRIYQGVLNDVTYLSDMLASRLADELERGYIRRQLSGADRK